MFVGLRLVVIVVSGGLRGDFLGAGPVLLLGAEYVGVSSLRNVGRCALGPGPFSVPTLCLRKHKTTPSPLLLSLTVEESFRN